MLLNRERKTNTAEKRANETHYTYIDCLRGVTPVPRTPNGKTLFTALMTGGMVTFMVTINGIRQTGLGFLTQSHWLYPLMFAIAFLVRSLVASKVVDALAPRLVLNRLTGVRKSIGMTLLNTGCMAPIMCAITTLLLLGTDNFAFTYVTTLPLIAPISALVNFFAVGPAVKLLYNRIAPADGLSLLGNLHSNAPALSRLLGF